MVEEKIKKAVRLGQEDIDDPACIQDNQLGYRLRIKPDLASLTFTGECYVDFTTGDEDRNVFRFHAKDLKFQTIQVNGLAASSTLDENFISETYLLNFEEGFKAHTSYIIKFEYEGKISATENFGVYCTVDPEFIKEK